MHLMFLNQLNNILLALCLLVLFSCASVKAPQGGPLDSEPPKLKSTSPTILTNLNQGQQITLFFNEFIKEESLKNAIELFPNVNQKIDFEYYGKEVIITLPSNLDKDKTYVISLNSNLSDEQNVKLNENIVIPISLSNSINQAAIKGKIDPLNGLKENVIVGRLVPAGTGNIKNKWNRKALEDDNKFLSEQEKIEPSETPVNQ